MSDEGELTLVIEIKNQRPVDLLDLTRCFEAIAQQYKDFVNERSNGGNDENIRLYVKEIRNGSIIAELISLAEQSSILVDSLSALGGFVTHLNEITSYFLGTKKDAPDVDKKELQKVSDMLEITAKDQGAQFNTFVASGGNLVQNFMIQLDTNQARSVQNGISRKISAKIKDAPSSEEFDEECLIIFQARGEASSKSGDLGIIDKFSDKPLRLRFASEKVKADILDEERVFKLVYVVRGKVETAGGQPVSYKIFEVLDTFERPEV